MSVATTYSISLTGLNGHLISVQTDISQGVVNTAMVGRVDASINESRDRCRAALKNCGLEWPSTRRVTVSLAPADLPKRGSHFDLAIAISVLAALGEVNADLLHDAVFIAELSLDGSLRPVTGILPMILAAAANQISTIFVPESQIELAKLNDGVTIYGVRSLAQVIAILNGTEIPASSVSRVSSETAFLSWRGKAAEPVDIADVVGHDQVKAALKIAAAGGHHLLLLGPKGVGKTTLAERLPGILPDLTKNEAIEVAAINSLTADGCHQLSFRPPYAAPHHSASRASMFGGGSGMVRPGQISRAHLGVLFLDEFPLFANDVIQALREPMENGQITITRGEEVGTFPAQTLMIIAANPCPCGDFFPGGNNCTCTEIRRRDYRRKLTGPVIDRVDITCNLAPVNPKLANDKFGLVETTASMAAEVAAARQRQATRFQGRSWRLNSQVPASELMKCWPVAAAAEKMLTEAMQTGQITHRGLIRTLRLSWTIADLAAAPQPDLAMAKQALQLRLGQATMARPS